MVCGPFLLQLLEEARGKTTLFPAQQLRLGFSSPEHNEHRLQISRNPLYMNITWLCQSIKVAYLAYAAYALNTWQAQEVTWGQIRWADGNNRSNAAQVCITL